MDPANKHGLQTCCVLGNYLTVTTFNCFNSPGFSMKFRMLALFILSREQPFVCTRHEIVFHLTTDAIQIFKKLVPNARLD